MSANWKVLSLGLILGFAGGVVFGAISVHAGLWPLRSESKAVRDTRVLTMTPAQFSARCGKLISDTLRHSLLSRASPFGTSMKNVPPDERDVIVRITLQDGNPQNVKAVFYKVKTADQKARWKLSTIGGYDTGTSALGSLGTIEELYPCTMKNKE